MIVRLAALCLLVATATVSADSLIGASCDDHVWFVVPPARPPGSIVLRHHARASGGPVYSRGFELGQAPKALPDALAAHGARVWMIFAPRGEDKALRQVFTVQILLNPAFGGWYYDPPDRLRVLPSLEGDGKLAGLVATDDGPVALLVPAGPQPLRARSGESRQRPRLMALRQSTWTEIELPQSFRGEGRARLAAAGGTIVVLEPALGDPRRSSSWWRDADGEWQASEIDLDLTRVVSLSTAGTMIVAASQTPGTAEVSVAYLRRDGMLPLARAIVPEQRFAVLGMLDGPRVVAINDSGDVVLRRIDPVSGVVGEPLVMGSQKLLAGGLWHLPLMVVVTILAVLLVFLFRPSPDRAVPLPAGLTPLRPFLRLTAVLVDLVAAGLVAAVILGVDRPDDFFRLPLWTPELEKAIPGFVMVGLTALHSTISEIVGGRTLGKLLVGARVIALDGSRPSPGPVILRNLVKLVVLLVPVLVVVSLFNPHWQGLDDQIGRTLVVGRVSRDPPAGNDR